MRPQSVGQAARLLILLIYVLALLSASRIALGTWIPPATEKGLWFFSGLAAVVLGSLLLTPYFSKPVDTISYSVGAMGALWGVYVPAESKAAFDIAFYFVIWGYLILLLVTAFVAILTKDSVDLVWQRFSKVAYFLSDRWGTPRFIFSIIFLFS